jgi:multimeric flavodoxin WrbA
MNIVVFHGSPRIDGNTDVLLREGLKAVNESRHSLHLFRLNTMNIRPCQNCGGCEDTGRCVLEDDMEEIDEAIRGADRIVVASPIFFFGLSAQTKIMVDRCQAFWCERYLLKRSIVSDPHGRKGLLILVGGMKKEIGIQCGGATATAFFRTVSVPEHETITFLGIDKKGAILDHPTALRDAFSAVERLLA